MAKAAITTAAGAAILAAAAALTWTALPAPVMAQDMVTDMADDMHEGPPPCIVPTAMNEDGTAGAITAEGLATGYNCFEDRLLAGYAQSKHALAGLLSEWERTSETPFIYDAVGERYLVVYANDLAIGEEETLWLDRDRPVGATLGIASFSLGPENQMIPEPLLIYEKLVQGYQFGRGNWRQTMIAPDGGLIGVTKGPGADQLTVCQDCAARSADRVYLALLNDGVMPPDAPEESAPIVENELGGPGSSADDGASGLDLPSDEELQGLGGDDGGIPGADTFDPNPGVESQELAPLDPLAPADSLDPLAPLEPLDDGLSEPDSPAAAMQEEDPLDPLAPLEAESDDGGLDPLAPLEESDAGTGPTDTAAASPANTGPAVEMGSEDAMAEPSGAAATADLDGTGPDADTGMRPGNDSPLDRALRDASDPLLAVPPVTTVDLPPFLEEPGERL
jgi:hypothetical protein